MIADKNIRVDGRLKQGWLKTDQQVTFLNVIQGDSDANLVDNRRGSVVVLETGLLDLGLRFEPEIPVLHSGQDPTHDLKKWLL